MIARDQDIEESKIKTLASLLFFPLCSFVSFVVECFLSSFDPRSSAKIRGKFAFPIPRSHSSDYSFPLCFKCLSFPIFDIAFFRPPSLCLASTDDARRDLSSPCGSSNNLHNARIKILANANRFFVNVQGCNQHPCKSLAGVVSPDRCTRLSALELNGHKD